MGCDEHLFIEKYEAATKSWHRAEKQVKNQYYESDCDPDDDWEASRPYVCEQWYTGGRNYNLYEVLANVRGSSIAPVSEPKGVPADMSDDLAIEYKQWGCDAHTPTHFTLQELRDYGWNKKTINAKGFVNSLEFMRLISRGHPESWHYDNFLTWYPHKADAVISVQEMTQKISQCVMQNEEYYPDVLLGKIPKDTKKRRRYWARQSKFRDTEVPHLCQFETMISPRQYSGSAEFSSTLRRMKKFCDTNELSYDQLRMVVWFDN